MSKIVSLLLQITLSSSFLLSGCEQRSQECRDVLEVPREEGYVKFRSYPIETQLEVYLCGMHSEPPDLGLANEISKQGDNVIPNVIHKLQVADREIDQEALIYLLEIMSDRGLLRGRKHVIADISSVIENMKIKGVKERSEQRLKKIQIANGIKPFTYVPQ